jgi:peptide/nickel transport system substrate-binding protein
MRCFPRSLTAKLSSTILLVGILLTACAAPQAAPRSQSPAGQSAPAGTAAPKRVGTAIMAEPPALYRALIPPGHVTQAAEVADTIVNMGLTQLDDAGVRRAMLAEDVPTVENGLWKLLPDGRMEVTWKIRPGVVWHDGTPLTAEDLRFTLELLQDPELPEFRAVAAGLIDQVIVVDDRTITALWSRPFIRADRLFATGSEGFGRPIPKHLVGQAYAENKDGIRQLPYWSTEYVGLGPYRLKEWAIGSHLLLEANDQYVPGRPKIDLLEVRFVLDANAVSANILSGAIDATMGTGLALEQAVEVRDLWSDGKLQVAYENWIVIYPQFINPNPPIVLNLQFRKALLHAIDRQAMADTIQAGLVPVAHSYASPGDPEYRETEQFVVKYDYDVTRATRMIEELGYAKGSDGVFRDSAGQRLALEVRATTSPAIHTKSLFPVADYWQRLGLAIDPVVIPVQRARDLEYRTQQPTFEVMRHPNGPNNAERLHSNEAPLPETRYSGRNRSRYMNPEFDALIDRYVATIPAAPRLQLFGQIVHHVSDQLNAMGLFYDLRTTLVSNRLQNVPAQHPTWNIHLWDVKS